jgi:3',5'-cyclic AMP phosphodiesterase CpdA
VNTAKPNPVMWRSSGYVAPGQLAAARALLACGELAGRQVIVATHYNADDRDTWRHGLENRREFRELLLGASCDLLVHGHVHRSGETAADASGPRSVCAGSLTYKGREAFRVYETGVGGITLRRGVWDGQRYLLSS